MGPERHLQIKITGAAVPHTRVALPGQPDLLALTYPLGDMHSKRPFLDLRSAIGTHLGMLQAQVPGGPVVGILEIDEHLGVTVVPSSVKRAALARRETPTEQ